MKKLDELSSLVLLWQKLPHGQAKDDVFTQVHDKVKGSIKRETPYIAWITGQQEDWEQEAAITLLEAMNGYRVGHKFITYFYFYIKLAKNNFYKHGRIAVQAAWNKKYKDATRNIAVVHVDGFEHANEFWGKLKSTSNKREIENVEYGIDLEKLSHKLKKMEIQALVHLMDGDSFRTAAGKMNLSPERVRQHLSNIIRVARKEPRNNSSARLDVRWD